MQNFCQQVTGFCTFDKSVVLCGAPALDLAHSDALGHQVRSVRQHAAPCGGPVTWGDDHEIILRTKVSNLSHISQASTLFAIFLD